MPDEQVRSAIANWGPRFTAQGVDPNDFARVTGGLERWEDWLDAWCANGDAHATLAADAAGRGRDQTAGEAWISAALSYHFGKFVWMLDMARHDLAADRAVAAMASAHRLLDPASERIEIPFDGAAMVGNLRRPPGITRPPLVLLIAGLDSTKEEFFAVENVFAARAAAFEPRVRALVVSGGCYDFGALIRGRPPHSLATFAYGCGAASSEEAYEFAGRMTLAGVLHRLSQPMIVVFGKRDRLVPWQQAAQVAREAPKAQLWMFDEGNHVCMNIIYRWRPQAADWLAAQLAAER